MDEDYKLQPGPSCNRLLLWASWMTWTPIYACTGGNIFPLQQVTCEQWITLPNQFWVICNFPITLLPLSLIATNTYIGTLPWKPTIEPKAIHHQMPYLNVPDQSSNNTQLSHQNHLKVKSTDQNIWIANSHRPKWTTTINIDSRYKSNVATKQPPITPKLQAPTNKIEWSPISFWLLAISSSCIP